MIARHSPTDIHAGRVPAQAIVKPMEKNDDFQKDFAEAKAEIAAARAAAKNQPPPFVSIQRAKSQSKSDRRFR